MSLCSPAPRTDGRSRRTRAFTFVELCFGLVITALVMSAVAAFTLATAQHWKQSDQEEATATQGRQATLRLTRTVQDAKLIGASRGGSLTNPATAPAAVILWVRDSNSDGAIQGAECAMIEHDRDAKLLRLYGAGQGDASVVLPWAIFTSDAMLTNFSVGRTSQPLARDVKGARIVPYGVGSATQNPMLEYTLKLGGGDEHSVIEYGTCSVRAPAKQPS